MNSSLRQAQWLALGVPVLLLAGAYLSQYGFDDYTRVKHVMSNIEA